MKRSRPYVQRSKSKPLSRVRLFLIFLLLLVPLLGLAARLFWLQLVQGEALAQKALSRQVYRAKSLGMRRPIIDRQGEILAWDEVRARIWAHPIYFQFPGDRDGQRRSVPEVSQKLAAPLELSTAELEKRLSGQATGIRLMENLSLAKGELVKALGISGIDIETYPQRRYPQGPLFANVLGFLNLERQPQSGLELSRDEQLQQQESSQWLLRSGNGVVLPIGLPIGAIREDTLQLQLSLDTRLQRVAHGALAKAVERWQALRAVAMVMDVSNGELLVMASQPSYDPNRFWEAEPHLFREWSVEDLYEPGSTFKPINLAIALEEGLITQDSKVHDTGTIQVGPWTISNHDNKANGLITMGQALNVSSNVAMVKTMVNLPPKRYWQWLGKLRIDQAPNTDLPGATGGYFKPLNTFVRDPIHGATVAFGQGITLTPLKLLQLHASLANGGWLVQPHLIQGLRSGTTLASTVLSQRQKIFDTNVAATVRGWMVESGNNLVISSSGQPIAGKTGTSQKVRNGVYAPDAIIASFVAHLPADQPRFVVLVVVDEPRGVGAAGSTVALPIAGPIIDSLVALENLDLST